MTRSSRSPGSGREPTPASSSSSASSRPTVELRIRYEDLCRDVTGTLRLAFAFMGVDPEAELQPIGQEQHMLGNQMRLSAPTDVRLDERWRTALPTDQAGAILRAAQPIFGQLYPEEVAPPRLVPRA